MGTIDKPVAEVFEAFSITSSRFCGNSHDITKQALDSTEGSTLVIAGLNAYLEHNMLLKLVADLFPND